MAHLTIRSIMDKMDNPDSDYRYMAMSDLQTHLKDPSLKADHDTEKRLARAVLKMLTDSHSEVQGMAAKCLGPLTAFADHSNASYIVDKLLDHILDVNNKSCSHAGSCEIVGQKAARDVASLGLKTIINDLAPSSSKAPAIANVVLPRLLPLISSAVSTPTNATKSKNANDPTDVLIDSLELLLDLVMRLGSLLTDSHKQITDALFVHLTSKNQLVRKRAVASLAALSGLCDKAIFVAIVERTLADLQSSASHETVRTGVQTISALARNAGHRLASHLQMLAPILFNYLSSPKYEEDDEFREHCLQALEAFCSRCRREMLPFATELVDCVVRLAKYDPNYIDDDEEEEGDDDDGDENMAEDEDVDDEFDDEDYSDDDDSSWKVRRASVRCILATVSAQLLPPRELCVAFGPFLVSRFKEREETVKLDIFSAFAELLRQCSGRSVEELASSTPGRSHVGSLDLMAVEEVRQPSSNFEPLASRSPQIIRTLKKELGARSPKVRIKSMALAREIVVALPTLAPALVGKGLSEIRQALGDSPASMKTETMLFLRSVLKHAGVGALADQVDGIMPRVLSCMEDRYYKVTAECLRFCSESMMAFGMSSQKPQLVKHVLPVQDNALGRATAQDQDSEVKDAAILCLGAGVARYGGDLGVERVGATADIMRDRLGNEVTRIATVRALHIIATSECADTLTQVMDDIAVTVTSFLRKSDPALRTASIELLSVAPSLPSANDATLIANLSELIRDSDLRLASIVLQLSTKIIKERGAQAIPHVVQNGSIYPNALALSVSPLLQGRAVDSLLDLFGRLAEVNGEPLTILRMLADLQQQANSVSFGTGTSSARGSPLFCVAKCIVAVCRAADPNVRVETTKKIIADISSDDFKTKIFALACLGEFGRGSLLPKEGKEKEAVQNAVLSALDASVEEVKTAAAVSLGGLASADSASGVPGLLDLIRQRPAQQYLLLLSLKEAIGSTKASDIRGQLETLLSLLLQSVRQTQEQSEDADDHRRSSEEESIRTVTAECLGLLVQSCPEITLNALMQAVTNGDADVRASVAAAVKFAVSSSTTRNTELSARLRDVIGTIVNLIGENDVTVAKNAVQAVNTIARSRPAILQPHLPVALSLVYPRTAKNKDLIRIVDLGPFKHEEDYGLDLRKAAFDCLRTLVSGPLCASIHVPGLLEHVVLGLRDQGDVRAIAQLILAAIAGTEAAPQMLNCMDAIVKALEATFNERLKENAVRQEVEKYEDSINGALRAVRAMERVPEIATNRTFVQLMTAVVRTSRFEAKYSVIIKSEVGIMGGVVLKRGGPGHMAGGGDRMEE